jgi:hypothetical protein
MFRCRIVFSLAALAFTPLQAAEEYQYQTGDVVFQSTSGEQAKAVRAATGSRYTHCGVIFEQDGAFKVLEASQPVKITPLEEFRQRSLPGTFEVRRLKEPLSPAAIEAGKAWGKQQVGLNYDPHFRWDDQTLYCSELVWKVFKKSGVELCPTKRFRDYELEAPEVKKVIEKRYGSADKMPQDEPVVSPGDLADSPLLVPVPKLSK